MPRTALTLTGAPPALRPLPPPTPAELHDAVEAACAAVGRLDLEAPAWDELLPLVHELADALVGADPSGEWPERPVVACRHLAAAVRRWRAAPWRGAVDGQLLVALAGLIELVAGHHDVG